VAAAQKLEVASGERGPRFLLAAGNSALPIDISRTPYLRRRISLDLENVTLKEALTAISEQAGLDLVYGSDVVPLENRIRLRADRLTVAAALTEVLLDAGVDVVFSRDGRATLVKRVDVALSRAGATIGGTVTDAATHEPIVAARVQVEGARLDALTGDDGKYSIAKVPAGTYTLSARRLGYTRSTHSVTVSDGDTVVMDFSMEKSASVLDQVVTTGTVVPTEVKALPSPISVITTDQIERRHAPLLTSIIRQAVPTAVTFDNQSNPTATQISVRGASSLSGAGSMKIFVDGVEAPSYDFAPVDPASIDRIEIVRGPQAATIYGADAAGGVIEIFTKRGDSTGRPRMNAKAAFGLMQTPYEGFESVPRQEYSMSLHGGGEDMSYHFGGGYDRLADYLPNDEISRQSVSSIYGGVHVATGVLQADLSARYLDHNAPQVTNPAFKGTGYVSLTPPGYKETNTLDETVSARLTATPTSWWHNQATLGISRHTTHIAQARPRFVTPSDSLRTVSNSAARKVSVGYNASLIGDLGQNVSGSWTVGMDHYSQDLDRFNSSRALNIEGTIQTSPSGSLSGSITSQTNTGYFTQAQVGVRDAIFLTAGVRAEDNSNYGADYGLAILPRYGVTLVKEIDAATVKLRASYGRALRTPSAGAALGSVTTTSILLANPRLAPEKQQGWDGGVDLVFGSRGSLSVTTFSQTARDLIAFLQVATTPLPTYQYQNIGRVENKGFEVEAAFMPSSRLALRAQYGDVRSRITEVGSAGGQVEVGDPPVNVPSRTGGATLTAIPREGTTIDVGLTYVGSRRSTDWVAELRCLATLSAPECPEAFLNSFSYREFLVSYPGFAKFNVGITQHINRRLDAYLAIDNLANKQAYEFDNLQPIIGRKTMLGIEITY
jgi:outer membrane receptor protein involved in Fe transport